MVRVQGALQDITDKKNAESTLRDTIAALREAQAVARTASWELRLDENILIWSTEAFKMFGVRPFEFKPSFESFMSFVPPEDRPLLMTAQDRALRGDAPLDIEHRIVRPDGEVRWIRERAELLPGTDQRPPRLAGTARDVTEEHHSAMVRWESTKQVTRLSGLYAALSQVNQAVVRLQTRDALFREVCEVLVNQAGFLMAAISWHDPETRQIVPVAVSGEMSEYIANVSIYSDERPEGRGPGGIAFRSNSPYIGNDYPDTPAVLPWQLVMRRAGFRSVAVFPIRIAAEPVGLLSVLASSGDFFQDKEVTLIEEAAANLSFALDAQIRTDELTVERERLAEAQAIAHLGSWASDIPTGSLAWSDEMYRIFEMDARAVTPSTKAFLRIVHPGDRAAVAALLRESRNSPTEHVFEHRVITPVGHTKTIQQCWRTIFDDAGVPVRATGTCQDVTYLRKAERNLRASEDLLRALALKLDSAQDAERAAIAREVHDRLGQSLTLLKMDSMRLGVLIGASPEARAIVTEMSRIIDDTARETRTIAMQLHPAALDDLGITAAIEIHVGHIARRAGLHADLRLADVDSRIGRMLSGAVYRILQESLTNIVRHAMATAVTVRLDVLGSELILEVTDDGRGFVRDTEFTASSLGLLSMRERAAAWNGTVTIADAEPCGTRVTLRVPLDATRADGTTE